MDKEIYIYSREGVERGVVFKGCYALISIRDPGSERVLYRRTEGFVAAIELSFDDVDPSGGFPLPGRAQLMSKGDAEQIAQFVQERRDEVDGFVIHCEAGISRSPAIASAIARYLNQPEEQFWQEYHPNRYVYETLNNRLCKAN